MEVNKGESSMVKEVKAVITLRSGKEVDLPTSKLEHKLQNPPLTHEWHFAAPPPHFAAAKWSGKMLLGCKITFELRNGMRKCHLAAKMAFGYEITFRL
ncbi:hypothetical protein CK203_113454 [Vitis vinifera]|uniref:Uncharacterized protein n=1 Tax=Vitis vinifera TaxID=29760 RepID=A0A438D3T0_VITVI|nr:hypothetical protein CK203_113454 [Vitis vinifera]